METIWIVMTFLSFVTRTTCQANVKHFSIEPDKIGKKLKIALIETLHDIDVLSNCARECFYFTDCASFNYNRLSKLCEMNSINSTEANEADWEEDKQFIFSNLDIWRKEMVYTCADKPCSSKQKCVPAMHYKCVAHCGEPVNAFNALVNTGGTLEGSVRNYACIERHVSTAPSLSVTCQANSEWTDLDFECIADCGDPLNVSYAIVDAGETFEGTTRNYTCIEGLISTSQSMSVTCQANTEWTDLKFQCIVYCGPPPDVRNADVMPGTEVANSRRTYTCREPYIPSATQMSVMCQTNSYWTSPLFHCKLITTCAELHNCNPTYADGIYWLVLDKFSTERRVRIQCLDMTFNPSEYIFLEYPTENIYYSAEGARVGTSIYTSIGINVTTLRVIQNRYRIMHTNWCDVNYAEVEPYEEFCNVIDFNLKISLKNTGLWFNPIPEWTFESPAYAERIVHLNKELEVHGTNGQHGRVTLANGIFLKIDENED